MRLSGPGDRLLSSVLISAFNALNKRAERGAGEKREGGRAQLQRPSQEMDSALKRPQTSIFSVTAATSHKLDHVIG